MIGRGAIRNPWLFHQIRQHQRGDPLFIPRGLDVLAYVRSLGRPDANPELLLNVAEVLGSASDRVRRERHRRRTS